MKSKHVIILIIYLVIDQIIKLLLINKNFVIVSNILEIEYAEVSGTVLYGIINSVYFSLLLLLLFAFIYYNIRVKKNKKIATPIILLIASACANIIDKMIRGYVVDYISIPALGISKINISDVMTVVSIIMLVFSEIKYIVKKINKKITEKK